MKCFFCDDDEQILHQMMSIIQVLRPSIDVSGFVSGIELLNTLQLDSLQTSPCDVLFLDIDMPMMTGLEVAEVLKQQVLAPLLIFVTSHDELVYDSLQYHPFGFVRKSYFSEEIERVISDCERELQSRQRRFSIYTEGQTVWLKLSEIEYFESDGNYLIAFSTEGEYRFRNTLAAVQETLEPYGFIRVHKGFLINQEAVKMMDSAHVHLSGGAMVPIGKNYMETSKKMLMRYMRL